MSARPPGAPGLVVQSSKRYALSQALVASVDKADGPCSHELPSWGGQSGSWQRDSFRWWCKTFLERNQQGEVTETGTSNLGEGLFEVVSSKPKT